MFYWYNRIIVKPPLSGWKDIYFAASGRIGWDVVTVIESFLSNGINPLIGSASKRRGLVDFI